MDAICGKIWPIHIGLLYHVIRPQYHLGESIVAYTFLCPNSRFVGFGFYSCDNLDDDTHVLFPDFFPKEQLAAISFLRGSQYIK